MAQNADESVAENTPSEIEEEQAIETDSDGSLDDTINSIDMREERDGVGVSADVRVGYFESEIDERDATSRVEAKMLSAVAGDCELSTNSIST